MNDKELEKFIEAYDNVKLKYGRLTFIPDKEDWRLFDQKADLAKFKAKWGLKATNAIMNRIARMYFLNDNR